MAHLRHSHLGALIIYKHYNIWTFGAHSHQHPWHIRRCTLQPLNMNHDFTIGIRVEMPFFAAECLGEVQLRVAGTEL